MPKIFFTIFKSNECIESEEEKFWCCYWCCPLLALMSLIPFKFLTISCKIDYINYQQDIFLWCGYKVMTPNHGQTGIKGCDCDRFPALVWLPGQSLMTIISSLSWMIKIICGESWEISTKKCSYLLIHIVQNPLSLGKNHL